MKGLCFIENTFMLKLTLKISNEASAFPMNKKLKTVLLTSVLLMASGSTYSFPGDHKDGHNSDAFSNYALQIVSIPFRVMSGIIGASIGVEQGIHQAITYAWCSPDQVDDTAVTADEKNTVNSNTATSTPLGCSDYEHDQKRRAFGDPVIEWAKYGFNYFDED